MTDDTTKRKLQAVRSSLVALLAIVDDTLADAEKTTGTNDRDLLNVEQADKQYNFGRDALLNANRAGNLELVRGARNRIMVERSALEAYIKSRPVKPRKTAPAEDLDAWERDAEKSLRSIGGGRK